MIAFAWPINSAFVSLSFPSLPTKSGPVPLSHSRFRTFGATSPDPRAACQMGLAGAGFTVLPARAAMDYHDSTVPGTAVSALIRPNLTWLGPPRSVQVRTNRPDDAGPRHDVPKHPPNQVDHPARRVSRPLALLLNCPAAAPERSAAPAVPARVEFNRDVRPILSDNCFLCHGPDKNRRKADLRLDLRDEALKAEAFVPGKPDESELVARIFSTDPDELMPPPKSNKKLDARQKEILKRWVEQGAEYQQHWSYEKPVKAQIPAGAERRRRAGAAAARRGRAEALARGRPPHPDPPAVFRPARPAADARRGRGVRRATPRPTPTSGWSTACWPARTTASAWRSAGSTWCGSPTRSATTATTPATSGPTATGSSRASTTTSPSTASPLEQIAGDLLPDANTETRVGSAFNRLLLSHRGRGRAAEGLRSPHADRPRPGRRGGVAGPDHRLRQCHDHKFDPFTMRDFYSLGAFFADIKEPIIGRREEGMVVDLGRGPEDPGQARRRASPRRRRRLEAVTPQLDAAQAAVGGRRRPLRRHAARACPRLEGHAGREDGRAGRARRR